MIGTIPFEFGRLWRFLLCAPATTIHWIKAIRRRGLFRKLFRNSQRLVRKNLYPSGTVIQVLTGPFRGLRYLDEIVFGPITPKWLGSYESEIQDIIEAICQREYRQIINLGCAEGYYAVGLAWRNPNCPVFAFDTDPLSRIQARKLAKINNLSNRITVRGECTHDELQRLGGTRSLFLIDIEGQEMYLLDPLKAPAIRQADILVEVHEADSSNDPSTAGSRLCDRFEQSHTIERRIPSDRCAWIQSNSDVWHRRLTRPEVLHATNEFRSGRQLWLWMRARPGVSH
jgi:hypothetical protein